MARHSRLGLVIGLVLLSAAACRHDPAESPSDSLTTNGAVAVLYANSYAGYDDTGQMRGAIVVVRPDGSFDAVETAGISVGSVVSVGNAVFGSDRTSDFAVDPSGLVWRERPDEQLLQETVARLGELPLIVFNSGVRDGEYWQDLSAWGSHGQLRGSVPGEPLDIASCRDRAYALTTAWRGRSADATLFEITEEEHRLRVEEAGSVPMPPSGGDLVALRCVDERIVAVSASRKDQRIAVVQPSGPPTTWREVVGTPIDGAICAADADALIALNVWRDGQLVSLDPESARGQVIGRVPGDDWVCSDADDGFMVISTGEGDDPVFRWFDGDGGQIDELAVDGLGSYMREHGLGIWGSPASLR